MATSVDLGGDTLYVNDVFVNDTAPGNPTGISVLTLLGGTGATGIADVEQFCQLTSSYTLGSSSTAQQCFNASTSGAVTVAGSTTYEFEGMYNITNTGTSSHTWSTAFGGTATLTAIAYQAEAADTTAATTVSATSGAFINVATAVPVTAASTSSTENVAVWVRGVVRTNAGGTFIPQIKSSVPLGATVATMVAGSFFRLWPIGSATAVTVGNWS